MKRIFTILFALLSVHYVCAQDTFATVQDVTGKGIYIISGNINPFTYIMIDGKLKLVQKDKKHSYTVNSRSYTVDPELYQYKKDKYIVLKGGADVFFLKVNDNPIYLSLMRNESYWKSYIVSLNDNYPYLDIENGRDYHGLTSDVVYDKLSKLSWTGFKWNNDNAVLCASEVSKSGVQQKSFTIMPSVFSAQKGKVFIHKNDVQPYIDAYEARLAKERLEQERRDSIYNCKLRLATAKKDMTFGDDDHTTYVSDGDTIAIYVYNDSIDNFVGRFRFRNLRFEEDDIKFIDEKYERVPGSYTYDYISESKDYLKRIGEKGIEGRFNSAFTYDSVRTAAWVSDLRAKVKAYNDRVSYMKKHQIFITKARYNYDGDQFGMDYTFYNCFGKTIKYVVVNLACYNNVGDLQRDDFGRATKTVRGIGPIAADEEASYSWEKIFWDEYDVIKNCKITSITFTFKDGTTRSFKGIANIRNHFSSDAWDD